MVTTTPGLFIDLVIVTTGWGASSMGLWEEEEEEEEEEVAIGSFEVIVVTSLTDSVEVG